MATLADLGKDIAKLVAEASDLVVQVAGEHSFSGLRWSEAGLVITSARFVGKVQKGGLGVVDASGKEYEAKVIGVDSRIDVAVLEVPGLAAAPAKRFESKSQPPATGELVLSLGRPGRVTRAALGLASAVSAEPWRTPAGGQLAYYLEVDGNLPEGFSGGPLLSADGLVIGMNTIAMPKGQGMTVPVATISAAITAIREGWSYHRLYLGVNSVPVPKPTGLMVTEIEAGSPADQGGLVVGDIIQELGGVTIRHYGDLVQALEAAGPKADRSKTIRLIRAGQSLDITIELSTKE